MTQHTNNDINKEFIIESKELLGILTNNFKQNNKIHSDDNLIALHSLKGIGLLFGLKKIVKLIFKIETLVFGFKNEHSPQFTNKDTRLIYALILKLDTLFRDKRAILNANMELTKHLAQFNSILNSQQSPVLLFVQTKIQNKISDKILIYIYEIMFELIKNTHTHGFVADFLSTESKTIRIKIYYKNKFLLVSYKDNGIGIKCFGNAKIKSVSPKMLSGFGVGMKLVSEKAKKLKTKIKVKNKKHYNGFGFLMHSL